MPAILTPLRPIRILAILRLPTPIHILAILTLPTPIHILAILTIPTASTPTRVPTTEHILGEAFEFDYYYYIY